MHAVARGVKTFSLEHLVEAVGLAEGARWQFFAETAVLEFLVLVCAQHTEAAARQVLSVACRKLTGLRKRIENSGGEKLQVGLSA